VLRSLLGFTGTVVIGFAVLGIAVILRTPWTLEEVGQAFVRAGQTVWQKMTSIVVAMREAWAEAREIHEEEIHANQPRISQPRVSQPKIMGGTVGHEDEHEHEDE